MKMTKYLAFLALTASIMTNAAYASQTVVTCNATGADDSIKIVQTSNNNLVAAVTTESFGGSYPTFHYKVNDVPTKPGVMGAGKTYEGAGLTLEINTDGADGKNGFEGHLSVPSISINERVNCTF
jgi:hypothetical protein